MRLLTCFLLSSAASLAMMGQSGSAMAQTSYGTSSGALNSSAAYQQGPSLPDLSPDQIAVDVVTEYNRRTGAPEAVGPTFDPFEQDADLAASVNLRTTDGVRAIDGTPLQDGVLLDIELYYTDYGDRPVGRSRDAVFMNGAPVPVVLSDSRELECSSRVTETIYHYDRYYSPGYGGLYRPRPRYFGHSLLDIHIWGGGGYHYGRRGYRGSRYTGHPRRYGPSYPSRPHRPVRPRPHRPDRVDRRRDRRPADVTPPRDMTRTVPGTDLPRSRVDYFINGQPADTYDKYREQETDRRPERRPRRTNRRGGETSSGDTSLPETVVPSRRARERRERVTVTPPRRTSRPAPARPVPSAPRRTEPRRVRPAPPPAPRPSATPRPKAKPDAPVISRPKPSPRKDPSSNVIERYNMFPNDRPRDGVIITSDRDCAREDRLTLFIPYERLEAARFDGMMIFVRDVSYDQRIDQTTVYDERPLYIPPNYIEGFRRGASLP